MLPAFLGSLSKDEEGLGHISKSHSIVIRRDKKRDMLLLSEMRFL
jgi:hypothetical protein